MAEAKATKPTRAKKTAAAPENAAKEKFSKAIEDAKAGAAALKAEAGERAGTYKAQAAAKSSELVEEAKVYGQQAKAKAGELAVEGKAKASDTIASLGKIVSDNAETIEEKFGTKYADYARTASRKMQETAAKIDAKDINELPEDAREFVRKKPGTALGIAAVAGFLIARIMGGSKK